MKTLIPSYFYPTHVDWAKILKANPRPAGVVINPHNGPGRKHDDNYQILCRKLRARSIPVYGYVYTGWAGRGIQEVMDDIDQHRIFYSVDGIFFDEAATGLKELSYYKALFNFCQELDLKVILNPGVTPDEYYTKISDIICNVETSEPRLLPDWVKKYPASKFWHIVFGVSEERMPAVVKNCKRARAGYVYVTDDHEDNPYDRLPLYWRKLCNTVSS